MAAQTVNSPVDEDVMTRRPSGDHCSRVFNDIMCRSDNCPTLMAKMGCRERNKVAPTLNVVMAFAGESFMAAGGTSCKTMCVHVESIG